MHAYRLPPVGSWIGALTKCLRPHFERSINSKAVARTTESLTRIMGDKRKYGCIVITSDIYKAPMSILRI